MVKQMALPRRLVKTATHRRVFGGKLAVTTSTLTWAPSRSTQGAAKIVATYMAYSVSSITQAKPDPVRLRIKTSAPIKKAINPKIAPPITRSEERRVGKERRTTE